MRGALNFVLFQCAWFACVMGAAAGNGWIGPVAVLLLVVVSVAHSTRRGAGLAFFLAVGVVGSLLDSGLLSLGLTGYERPHAVLPGWMVPAWIAALWIGFATLPQLSLSWLQGRIGLAAVFGAIGGPLSFLAGVRLGAVSLPAGEAAGLSALAVQYAILVPLLVVLSQLCVGRGAGVGEVASEASAQDAPGP